MMRVLLIARQEFVKFVTRRGFLFTLIGVPMWIALAVIVPEKLSAPADRHLSFAVVDRSNQALPAIAGALARRAAKDNDDLRLVPPPDALVNAPPDRFGVRARPFLNEKSGTLDAVVVIPKDFDASHPAQFWSAKDSPRLRDFVQAELTAVLRLRALHKLDDAHAQAALDVEAQLSQRTPPQAGGGITAEETSVGISVGMAILLLIVALMNSMALLQGVIEEKSTRMIEVLLSCATPWEIVGGKIMGVVAVALFTILIWVSAAVFLGSLFAGQAAGALITGILYALSDPTLLPLIVLYFLCGLLIYGAIFLSIGSMCASLADAQAYLGPSMMIIMLPNLFLSAILKAPDGTLAIAASYFPIYTPYIMLLRIGSHPPAIEIATTALLAVVVTVFLVWQAGGIFARHALATEKPPKLASLFRRVQNT